MSSETGLKVNKLNSQVG